MLAGLAAVGLVANGLFIIARTFRRLIFAMGCVPPPAPDLLITLRNPDSILVKWALLFPPVDGDTQGPVTPEGIRMFFS